MLNGSHTRTEWHHIIRRARGTFSDVIRPLFINGTRRTVQMLYASGFHNTVKYMYSGSSYSDHFLDGTKRGSPSLSEYHRMTTGSHPRFPVERSSQYWQKLTSLLLRFCGLALCQNRILLKLKNLLIQVKKKKNLLCCFYNQIRGWGNFDLFKNVFFLLVPFMVLRRHYI